MPDPIDWERPLHEPDWGDDGSGLCFFVVFGDLGTPPDTDPDRRDPFLSGQLGTLLRTDLPEIADAVRAAPNLRVIAAPLPDAPTANALRDLIGVIDGLLDHGGIAVLDALALHWSSAAAWKTDVSPDAAFVPTRHAGILVSEEDPVPGQPRTVWLHTRGMRKFARPDLSLHGVRESDLAFSIDLLNRLIDIQARGARLADGQPIATPDNPVGLICRPTGTLDDPDFNNVHIELRRATAS